MVRRTTLGLAIGILMLVGCARETPPTTLGDVEGKLRASASNPRDKEAALAGSMAAARMATEVGTMLRAEAATRAAVAATPEFARKPEIRQKVDKLDGLVDQYLRRRGLADRNAWIALLTKAEAATRRLLDRSDLEPTERSAVHTLRARLFLVWPDPVRSLEEADRALALENGNAMAHIARSDALLELRRYDESLQSLRAASLRLSAWANERPSLSHRLAWSIHGPGRSSWRERRWRENRRRIVAGLRAQLQTDASVIRSLQSLDRR